MGIQGYHDTSSGRSPTNYLQPPVLHRPHTLHYPPPPPPPMQGARSHFHPQVVASSYRLPTISSRGPVPPQVGVEAGPRHPGPVPPTGIRIYRSNRGGVAPEATSRHHNLPYLRMLPAEVIFSHHFCNFPFPLSLSVILFYLKCSIWYISSHQLLGFFCNMH